MSKEKRKTIAGNYTGESIYKLHIQRHTIAITSTIQCKIWIKAKMLNWALKEKKKPNKTKNNKNVTILWIRIQWQLNNNRIFVCAFVLYPILCVCFNTLSHKHRFFYVYNKTAQHPKKKNKKNNNKWKSNRNGKQYKTMVHNEKQIMQKKKIDGIERKLKLVKLFGNETNGKDGNITTTTKIAD